jgi:hypothetical protein
VLKRSLKPMKRTPMRKVGKVGRRRLATSRKLTKQAQSNGHDFCEVGAILAERKIDTGPCMWSLTNAHSCKTERRYGRPELDMESARSCKRHHYLCLDLLSPEKQTEIVREAIQRRDKGNSGVGLQGIEFRD